MKVSGRLALMFWALSQLVAQTPTVPAKSDRQQSEAAYLRGLAEDQAGHSDDAIAAYSQAIEFNPASAHAWEGRGKDYLAAQDWANAATDLEHYVKLLPTGGEGHAALGQAYLHLGRNEQAVAEFTQAISLRADDQSSYMNRGITRVRLGQYREAIEDFDYCLRASPASDDALVQRAVAYGAAGQYRQAADDLTSALKIAPENLRAFWVRGAIRELLDDLEGAVSDYTECIRLNPNDVRFLLARGSVYQRLMKYTLSVEDRDRAVKLTPQNAAAYLDRSETFLSLGKIEEALADQTTAIGLAPAASRTWFSRGSSYFRMGRYSDALADLKEAFRLDPFDGDIQRMMDQARQDAIENAPNRSLGNTPLVPASMEHVPAPLARSVPPLAIATVPRVSPSTPPMEVADSPANSQGSAFSGPSAPPASSSPPRAERADARQPRPSLILPQTELSSASHATPELPTPPELELRGSAVARALPPSLAALMTVPAPPRKFVPVFPAARPIERPTRPLPVPPHIAMTGTTVAATQNVFALLARLETAREVPIRSGGGTQVPFAPPLTFASARTSPAVKPTTEPSTRTAEVRAFLDSEDTLQFQLPSSPARTQKPSLFALQTLTRPARNLLLEGQSLVLRGRYAKAVDVLTAALKLAPRLPQAFSLRGYAHMKSKQYPEALSDFNEAIRLNPSDIDSYLCRAYTRRSAGDTAGAEADEDKASELVRPSITP